jgi:DNA-binding response OmpR family regulator
MKILVIEDKVSLTDAIAEYLKQKKNIVTIKNDGEKVLLRLEMKYMMLLFLI